MAGELGVPSLDVKVVPADVDRFGEGHGFNTSPSGGTSAAIAHTAAKILDKGRLLAGMALEALPDSLEVGGRRVEGRRSAPRRSRTSRSTRTAPARCRPASRAGSTPRRSIAIEAGTSTSSSTFRVPNSAENGFMPQRVCVIVAVPLTFPVFDHEIEAQRLGAAGERELAVNPEPPVRARRSRWNGT